MRSAMSMPSFESSPWMRGAPHRGFAAAIVRGALLSPALTWLTAGALVVMAATRFVPLAAALLYIGPAAGIVAFWPLAYWMWRHAESRVAP